MSANTNPGIVYVCLLMLSIAVNACGGSDTAAGGSRPRIDAPSDVLPLFPPPRTVAGLTAPQLSGVDSVERSAAALPFGAVLDFDATAAGSLPQWALYRLNPGGQWDSVSVLLDSAAGAYICLANYSTQRWVPHGPFTGLTTLAVPASEYRSTAGDLWVAVICPAGSHALVYALSTSAPDPGNSAPSADLSADVSSGTIPLTVNFDASGSSDPDGNIVQYAWDFDGDGLWDSFTDSAQTSHTYNASGTFSAGLRVTDNRLAHSAPASLDISANLAPLAQLTTGTLADVPGAALDLNASASSDPDGSITDYEWDFDGNGSFNEAGDEAAQRGQSAASISFPATPRYFSVSVRVTDDRGAQDMAALDLTTQGWLKLTVDDNAAPGATNYNSSQSSLTLIGGKPAIGYRANGTLRYAWSTAEDGSSGWNSLEVDDTCMPGQVALAQINGKPAIGYDGQDLLGSTEVRYAWSTVEDGSSGWSSLLLDSNGGYDLSIALTELDGFPYVAYIEDTMGQVVYGRSSAPDGSGGWSFDLDFGGVGAISRLVAVDGKPALALAGGMLKFIRNSAADGSGTWNSVDADSTANVGRFLSLALVGGRPAASHSNFFDNDLIYSWSTAADGGSGWSSVTIAGAGSAGGPTALAEVEGFPAIFYYDAANDTLKLARSSMADGSGGWSSSVVESGAGLFLSMALLGSGQVALSYYDTVSGHLKYAVLFE